MLAQRWKLIRAKTKQNGAVAPRPACPVDGGPHVIRIGPIRSRQYRKIGISAYSVKYTETLKQQCRQVLAKKSVPSR